MSKHKAKHKKSNKAAIESDGVEALSTYRQQRRFFAKPKPVMSRDNGIASKSEEAGVRRGTDEDEDSFAGSYGLNGLLEPPYDFKRLWGVYEESDVLSSNIQALALNCERPHDFEFRKDDTKDKNDPEAQRELAMLSDFFSRVNEKYSLLRLRRKTRKDREVTGNAFWEVIRNREGQVERLYYIPATKMRATQLDDQWVPVTERLPRDGKIIELDSFRKFRRFARWLDTGEMVWFKEFGDPRMMDSTNGQYTNSPIKPATEIWWFRDPIAGETYGVPRWVSAFLEVKARRLASWVNYDTLDSGAVPPFAILAQGGKFSKGTIEYIQQIVKDWRDPAVYNQPMVLVLEPDIMGVDLNTGAAKSSGARLDIQKLRDDRSEDYMFRDYLKHTEEALGSVFRIPAIIRGAAENYNYASAYAALEFAETQVFQPIREEFDEEVNIKLLQEEFNIRYWRLKTKAATIGNKEEFYRAAGMWGRTGGPSLNQMLQLANEAFGTDWSPYQGELYNKLPLALLTQFIGLGKIGLKMNGELEIVTQPAGQLGSAGGGGDLPDFSSGGGQTPHDDGSTNSADRWVNPGIDPVDSGNSKPSDAAQKTETAMAPSPQKRALSPRESNADLLYRLLSRIEQETEASDPLPIDDEDYRL